MALHDVYRMNDHIYAFKQSGPAIPAGVPRAGLGETLLEAGVEAVDCKAATTAAAVTASLTIDSWLDFIYWQWDIAKLDLS